MWIPDGLVVSETGAFEWELALVATYRRAAYAAIGRGGEIGGEVVERRGGLGVRIHLNPVGARRLLCFHCEDGCVCVCVGEDRRKQRGERRDSEGFSDQRERDA